MVTPEEAQALFASLAQESGDDIDLLEGALLVAAALGSDVDFDEVRASLDRFGRRVKEVMQWAGDAAPDCDPKAAIMSINRVLFVEAHLHGNEENYYDHDNSFLNRVLETRSGLPITLSIIYLEVARRAGLELRGIGLPGHFVVGHFVTRRDEAPDIIVDPFNAGQFLSRRECAAIVHGMSDSTEGLERSLRPVPARSILWRMLNNLKQIYLSHDMLPQLAVTIDLMLALDPSASDELRERAFLSYRSGRFDQAHEDIVRYLDAAPSEQERDRLGYYRRLFERLSVSKN